MGFEPTHRANRLTNICKPPTLPPMIQHPTNPQYIAGVSGGKDSAAALAWLVRESGIDPARITATFCDIGNDHPATLAHVEWLSQHVHPIATIYPDWQDVTDDRTGRLTFADLVRWKGFFPTAVRRYCTEILKIFPAQRFVASIRSTGRTPVVVSGVRAGESAERAQLAELELSGNLLCLEWRPLLRWSLDDVFALHTKHSIPLNPLYALGARRVGCWPCVMCNKEEMRTIVLHDPHRLDQIRELEAELSASRPGKPRTFFAIDKVPERFRDLDFLTKAGRTVRVPSIDAVARWSLTGKRARGTWQDDPDTPVGCSSGYCE